MKKHLLNPFANAAYYSVRGLVRTNDVRGRLAAWSDESYYWLALQSVWSELHHYPTLDGGDWNGLAATPDDLTAALRSQGVPESAFRPFGAHTLVTLDNLSFVYRAKRYKNGPHLLVAPHITGLPYSQCGHTEVHPYDSLTGFAQTMVLLDQSVPSIREACTDALADGRKECAERAIKTPAAESLLKDIFGGTVPENVRFHLDGLKRPGDLDIVRLEILDEPGGPWHAHVVDIPLDIPRDCLPQLAQLCLAPAGDMPHSRVDVLLDDETGANVPYLVNTAFDRGR